MANIVNGVNLDDINATATAIKADPKVAQVKFKAKSTWAGGCRANIEVAQIEIAGGDAMPPTRHFVVRTDEPSPLGGTDEAPNPAELLAASLCGCLTAGIATNAALFDTNIENLEVTVEANWDLHGLFGFDKSVPAGSTGIHYTVRIKGDDPEKLRRCKETLDRKSAVRKTLELAVPITSELIIE